MFCYTATMAAPQPRAVTVRSIKFARGTGNLCFHRQGNINTGSKKLCLHFRNCAETLQA